MQVMSHDKKFVLKKDRKVKIMGDKDSLEQVILNLLANAVKYSPQNGEITVTLRQSKNVALLEVADQGGGIPEVERKKIFEKFYQVTGGAKGGFGLGLFISKQIVQRHQGKIWVEANGSIGSKFVVALPVK